MTKGKKSIGGWGVWEEYRFFGKRILDLVIGER